MNDQFMLNSSYGLTTPARCRRGTGSLDLLVSFTLLVTAISVATPLVVRHGRLLRSQRDYRLALDELSNQIDRLTALPLDELTQAVKQLSPSPFVTERLAGARLSGELQPAESGTRITLALSWNETERVRAPVTLAAWVFAPPPQPGKDSAEASPQ
jgi:hypothetical protein